MHKNKIAGYVLIAVAIFILIFVWYKNSAQAGVPIVFSDKSMIGSLWNEYKTEYLEKDTLRALDKQQGDITTSEGQSYTMLRAVWMDDKTTFDTAYKWSKDNLQRKEDHLFSWLFGKKTGTTYGVLTDKGGYNAATDADTDMALSLLFAYDRWHDDAYLQDAKAIINDIWAKEVVAVKGVPYITADNLEGASPKPLINTSYFEPYAYRIFAGVDKQHDWLAVASSSYDVLEKAADSKLDATSTAALPPDWVSINRSTGAISPSGVKNLTSNFGYDALRVPFRVALDYAWFKEPRAKAYLDRLGVLSSEWNTFHILPSVQSHSGAAISTDEAPAMYGGSMGYFVTSDPAAGKEIYEQKLSYLVNQDTNTWKTGLSYYDSNWAWFGMALYDGMLQNLSATTQ